MSTSFSRLSLNVKRQLQSCWTPACWYWMRQRYLFVTLSITVFLFQWVFGWWQPWEHIWRASRWFCGTGIGTKILPNLLTFYCSQYFTSNFYPQSELKVKFYHIFRRKKTNFKCKTLNREIIALFLLLAFVL